MSYSLLDTSQLWLIKKDVQLENKGDLWAPSCSRCNWTLIRNSKNICQWHINIEGKFEDQKLNKNEKQGCAHYITIPDPTQLWTLEGSRLVDNANLWKSPDHWKFKPKNNETDKFYIKKIGEVKS